MPNIVITSFDGFGKTATGIKFQISFVIPKKEPNKYPKRILNNPPIDIIPIKLLKEVYFFELKYKMAPIIKSNKP